MATDAAYKTLFRKIGHFARRHRQLKNLREFFRRDRTHVLEFNEAADKLSAWTFAGVDYGVNTDEDGYLYVTLTDETPGAGQARVSVYSDSARTALVAQGDAADGNTATLTAQNSSGLTGTVLLGTVGATNADIELLVVRDLPMGLILVLNDDQYDADALAAARIGDAQIVALLDQAIQRNKGAFEVFARTVIKTFVTSTETEIFRHTVDDDGTGLLTLETKGILDDLNDHMADNPGGTAQYIADPNPTLSAWTADSDNDGVVSFTGDAAKDWAQDGTVKVQCTDATLGSEKFEVTFIDSITKATKKARKDATIKKAFVDPDVGLAFTMNRSVSETNDGNNQLSSYAISGENADNTNGGVLYFAIRANGTDWDIQVFKTANGAANNTTADLVAQGTTTASSGTETVTLVEQNASGLSGSVVFDHDATNAEDTDIQLDLRVCSLNDRWTATITATYSGAVFAEFFADLFSMVPRVTATGTAIDDSLASVGTYRASM